MTFSYLCLSIGLMALVTYLPRVLPLILFRKRIENKFFQSLLLYMPYAILAAMVFPDVFFLYKRMGLRRMRHNCCVGYVLFSLWAHARSHCLYLYRVSHRAACSLPIVFLTAAVHILCRVFIYC